MIDQARLLCLYAADKMDRFGNKEARREIAMIKIAAPAMLNQIVDWAIQAYGAAGRRHYARFRSRLRLCARASCVSWMARTKSIAINSAVWRLISIETEIDSLRS